MPKRDDDRKRTTMQQTPDEPEVESKRSEDSDEVTTERLMPKDRNTMKRGQMGETADESEPESKRSVDSDEVTTERLIPKDRNTMKRTTMQQTPDEPEVESKRSDEDEPEVESKRSDDDEPEVESKRSEDSDEVTTERLMPKRDDDRKRTTMQQTPDEPEVESKRSEDDDEVATEMPESSFGNQIEKRGDKRSFPVDLVERGMEPELFTTFESTTEFNHRAVRYMDGEPIQLEMTTISEPTSSFETLARSTGLLDTPSTDGPTQGTFEKDITTSKPNN